MAHRAEITSVGLLPGLQNQWLVLVRNNNLVQVMVYHLSVAFLSSGRLQLSFEKNTDRCQSQEIASHGSTPLHCTREGWLVVISMPAQLAVVGAGHFSGFGARTQVSHIKPDFVSHQVTMGRRVNIFCKEIDNYFSQ